MKFKAKERNFLNFAKHIIMSKKPYLYRLLNRATSNPLFENNIIGNYKITPQHGVNIFIYHIYKLINNKETHYLTVKISNGIYIEPQRALKAHENKTIVNFFLNKYRGKSMIVKEF